MVENLWYLDTVHNFINSISAVCTWPLLLIYYLELAIIFLSICCFTLVFVHIFQPLWYHWYTTIESDMLVMCEGFFTVLIYILIIDLYIWYPVAIGVSKELKLGSIKVSAKLYSFYSCSPHPPPETRKHSTLLWNKAVGCHFVSLSALLSISSLLVM